MTELTKYQTFFSKTTGKAILKNKKLKKKKKRIKKSEEVIWNLNGKLQINSYVGRILKNELKANDFFHLIAKAKFHIRYIFKDEKICYSVVSNLFSTLQNSFPVKGCSYEVRIPPEWDISYE